MDKTIVAAIIGAIGAIVAAIIGVILGRRMIKKRIQRRPKPSPRQLYLLGVNIAKLGWGKLTKPQGLGNIQVVTITMLKELRIPGRIKAEFESFLKRDYTIKDLTKALPRIKKLFGTYLASTYDKQSAGFYNIGFNVVNIAPMFEIASLQVNAVGPVVVNQLKGIIKEARVLKMPTRGLNEILRRLQRGLTESQGEVFDDGRQKLIEVGEQYIDILSKRKTNQTA